MDTVKTCEYFLCVCAIDIGYSSIKVMVTKVLLEQEAQNTGLVSLLKAFNRFDRLQTNGM